MKLGSPKPQIFVNLEVRINILIGNARNCKRIKQKVSEKKVQMVPISLRPSLDLFSIVWICLLQKQRKQLNLINPTFNR